VALRCLVENEVTLHPLLGGATIAIGIVIAAFGMILKSCAEFGSPMVEGPRPEQRSR
jgi:hypothetical protein